MLLFLDSSWWVGGRAYLTQVLIDLVHYTLRYRRFEHEMGEWSVEYMSPCASWPELQHEGPSFRRSYDGKYMLRRTLLSARPAPL